MRRVSIIFLIAIMLICLTSCTPEKTEPEKNWVAPTLVEFSGVSMQTPDEVFTYQGISVPVYSGYKKEQYPNYQGYFLGGVDYRIDIKPYLNGESKEFNRDIIEFNGDIEFDDNIGQWEENDVQYSVYSGREAGDIEQPNVYTVVLGYHEETRHGFSVVITQYEVWAGSSSNEALEAIVNGISYSPEETLVDYYEEKAQSVSNDVESGFADDVITEEEEATLIANAQSVVKESLQSPGSAEFPWSFDEYVITKLGNGEHEGTTCYGIKGYVDSENNNGGTVRSIFVVRLDVNNVSGDYYVVGIELE